jgi:peptide deformylase
MKANGGVGIAAPQIGVPLQVVVFGFQHSQRYSHANPVSETVLINPSYVALDDETYEDWEGCLSVKGLRGLVKRHLKIKYHGYNQFGQAIEETASGFKARLVQHEIDHLHGTLFIERVVNLKNFGFEDEIQELMKESGAKLG